MTIYLPFLAQQVRTSIQISVDQILKWTGHVKDGGPGVEPTKNFSGLRTPFQNQGNALLNAGESLLNAVTLK